MAGQGRGAGGGSRGQVGVGPSSWFGAGGVAAAGGVGERGAASLTWVLGQASGDMMTGGVFSLAGGVRPLSLCRVSAPRRVARAAGRLLAGAGRGVP